MNLRGAMTSQRLSDGARLILFLISLFVACAILSYFLRPILSAIGLSTVLSYLLSKPILKIEQYFGFKRSSVILVVLTLINLVVVLAGVFLLPSVYRQLIQLIEKIPNAVYSFQTIWIPQIVNFFASLGVNIPSTFGAEIRNFQVASQLEARLTSAMTTVWESAPIFLSTLSNAILIPPFTYLMLVHQKKIYHFIQDLVPRGLLSPIRRLALTADEALQAVIKGHLSVASILVVLYTLGFVISGLPFGAAIGIVAGSCRIIPYGDLVVGVILSAIAILTSGANFDNSVILSVIGVIVAVQLIDAVYITPKIIGGRLGVHPVISIAAIFALGGVFGFWGVMLAIPSAALIRQTWRGLIPMYLDSKFYRE